VTFDRTFLDVEKAKEILSKMKQFADLTLQEIETLEKGTITYNTLNRIEDKQRKVADALNELKYLDEKIITRNWTVDDIFDESDLQRIVNNTIVLRNSFTVIDKNQANPKAEYLFTEINAIEKILSEIDTLIERLKFSKSGTFYANSRNILPLKGE
jgi:hypothetical protein